MRAPSGGDTPDPARRDGRGGHHLVGGGRRRRAAGAPVSRAHHGVAAADGTSGRPRRRADRRGRDRSERADRFRASDGRAVSAPPDDDSPVPAAPARGGRRRGARLPRGQHRPPQRTVHGPAATPAAHRPQRLALPVGPDRLRRRGPRDGRRHGCVRLRRGDQPGVPDRPDVHAAQQAGGDTRAVPRPRRRDGQRDAVELAVLDDRRRLPRLGLRRQPGDLQHGRARLDAGGLAPGRGDLRPLRRRRHHPGPRPRRLHLLRRLGPDLRHPRRVHQLLDRRRTGLRRRPEDAGPQLHRRRVPRHLQAVRQRPLRPRLGLHQDAVGPDARDDGRAERLPRGRSHPRPRPRRRQGGRHGARAGLLPRDGRVGTDHGLGGLPSGQPVEPG